MRNNREKETKPNVFKIKHKMNNTATQIARIKRHIDQSIEVENRKKIKSLEKYEKKQINKN